MKNKIINVFMFAAGSAIGSAVTWKLVKTKYEQIANEEIASVKEVFLNKEKESLQRTEKLNESLKALVVDDIKCDEQLEMDFDEYEEGLSSYGYTNYSNSNSKEKGVDNMINKPYIISPDEFDELDDYDVVSLTYYSDGVIADDMDNIIEDVDSLIGYDAVNHFGEYEDDSVFVRNDNTKTDYEILLDLRAYSKVKNRPPHQVE